MNTIAKLKAEDRKFVFLKTSETIGKTISIIEKDYWVCYLLDYLFNFMLNLYRNSCRYI